MSTAMNGGFGFDTFWGVQNVVETHFFSKLVHGTIHERFVLLPLRVFWFVGHFGEVVLERISDVLALSSGPGLFQAFSFHAVGEADQQNH